MSKYVLNRTVPEINILIDVKWSAIILNDPAMAMGFRGYHALSTIYTQRKIRKKEKKLCFN